MIRKVKILNFLKIIKQIDLKILYFKGRSCKLSNDIINLFFNKY